MPASTTLCESSIQRIVYHEKLHQLLPTQQFRMQQLLSAPTGTEPYCEKYVPATLSQQQTDQLQGVGATCRQCSSRPLRNT